MKAAFSRANPSPRYQRLLALYREMHRDGEVRLGIPPDRTFPGKSLPPQAGHIKRLMEATGAKTLLRLQLDHSGPQGTIRGGEILTNRGEWPQLSQAAP